MCIINFDHILILWVNQYNDYFVIFIYFVVVLTGSYVVHAGLSFWSSSLHLLSAMIRCGVPCRLLCSTGDRTHARRALCQMSYLLCPSRLLFFFFVCFSDSWLLIGQNELGWASFYAFLGSICVNLKVFPSLFKLWNLSFNPLLSLWGLGCKFPKGRLLYAFLGMCFLLQNRDIPSVSVGCWDCAQSLIKASFQLPDTAYLQHVSSGPHFRMGHHHRSGYTPLTHPITISLATRLLLMDSSVLAWALIELHTAWTSDDCIVYILQPLCLVRRFHLGPLPQTMTSAYAAHQHHDALLGSLSYNIAGTCPLTPSLDFS